MIVFHERIDSAETISQLLDKRGPINPTKFL